MMDKQVLEHEVQAYNNISQALALQVQAGKAKLGLKEGEEVRLITIDSPENPGVQRLYVLQTVGRFAQFFVQLGFFIGELEYSFIVGEVELKIGEFDKNNIQYGQDED